MGGEGQSRLHEDDMVSVAEAARVARRSVRTIRRAYSSGKLVAHRDGNGRGVSIRYGDLVLWLTAELIGPTPDAAPAPPMRQVDPQSGVARHAQTGNLQLLKAVREQRPRRARATSARTVPKRAGSQTS